MTIIGELKRGIRASGKSLSAIARESGVNMSGLSRLMSGERPSVNIHTAEAIASAIGMEIIIRRRPGKGKGKHGAAKQSIEARQWERESVSAQRARAVDRGMDNAQRQAARQEHADNRQAGGWAHPEQVDGR